MDCVAFFKFFCMLLVGSRTQEIYLNIGLISDVSRSNEHLPKFNMALAAIDLLLDVQERVYVELHLDVMLVFDL